MNNSNNFFQLVAELQKNIDLLNQVLKGGELDSINIEGEIKPSISKDIADKWSAISTMIQGRLAFPTKASMEADTNRPVDTIAEVWNDPSDSNNGLYGWNGSSWMRSQYDSIFALQNSVDSLFGTTSSLDRVSMEAVADDEFEYAITDAEGNITFGIKKDGSVFNVGTIEKTNTVETTNDYLWALVDNRNAVIFGVTKAGDLSIGDVIDSTLEPESASGFVWALADKLNRVSLGVKEDGSLVTPGALESVLSDDESEGFAWALHDLQNKVALGIKQSGEVIAPGLVIDSFPIYEKNGQIHSVMVNYERQLTTEGTNIGPVWAGKQIRFASNRTGVWSEWVMNADGSDQKPVIGDRLEAVLITGQSLAEGSANSAITVTPPHPQHAFRLTNGPVGRRSELLTMPLKSLSEEGTETISTGFGRALLDVALDRKLIVSGQAWGGAAYSQIKKGGEYGVYEKIIDQVVIMKELIPAYKGVFVIHGEADGIISNTDYDKNLAEWQSDFSSDIQQETGQTETVKLFLCQTSSAAGYKNEDVRDEFTTPFLQLKASEENTNIFMIGPKYQFNYKDHAHIDAPSTRVLGEYYAKVYRQVVDRHIDWKPTSPIAINAVGNTIVIDYHVPYPPLTIDTSRVIDPGSLGFNLLNVGDITITDVALTDTAQITITCSGSVPVGAVVSYAFHNGVNGKSGWQNGARGCVRDSDPQISKYDSEPMFNWSVTFKHQF